MSEKFTWGQTAFDKMSHEELLLIAKKMYQPFLGMKCELRMMQRQLSGYCRDQTLPNAENVLDEIHSITSEENMFRQYFRYANDFLHEYGSSRWHFCPKKGCDNLLGTDNGTPECFEHKTKMKPITWKLFP